MRSLPLATLSVSANVISAWLGLIAGTSGIVYGLKAKQFTAFGHLSNREPQRLIPTWRYCFFVISISAIAVFSSLAFLLKAR